MSIDSTAKPYNYCGLHGGFYERSCPNCDAMRGQHHPQLPPFSVRCSIHGLHAGGPCAECLAEQQPPHLLKLIHEQRRIIGTLESRIADLEADLVRLRQRTNGQAQWNADSQRAHNALATAVEQLLPKALA